MYPLPYFQMICNDIRSLQKYIWCVPENAKVFGDKISELIILMGTEIDTLFNHLVGGKQPNMRDYKNWLKKHHQKIEKVQYHSFLYDESRPIFNSLNAKTHYVWWRAYTNIKHNRYKHINQANLDNLHDIQAAYYATCALAVKNNPSSLRQLKNTYAVICCPDIIKDKFATYESAVKSLAEKSAPGYYLDL